MKKKRTKPFNVAVVPAAAGATESAASSNVKALIHDHSLFFDKLIELIPAKFYLPSSADDKVWFQGLSKQEKVEAKQKSIENTKKARRDRLDPEKSSKTTLDVLKECIENENSKAQAPDVGADELSGVDGVARADFANMEGDERSVTYEELRERLRKKLEELKAGRGGGLGKKDNEKRERREGKKRKRNEESNNKAEESNESGRKEKERDIAKEVSEAAKGIMFGKVKLGDKEGRDRKTKKKKKKLSKEKELESVLKLEEEAKKDPEEAKKHAWKVVTDRAMGRKVHDNPKLLKQSIKKEERKHKKSVEKWKERMKTAEMRKQEKQEKRKENIKSKIEQKKKRKIEKREKKLMRPGFEGRKEGFINGA